MNVLVIAAHPDDETLGCGGAILRHRQAGDSVYWAIVTEAKSGSWSEEVIAAKAAEVAAVAAAYGIEKFWKLGFPTVKLDNIEQALLIQSIRDVVAAVRPAVVYLVHQGDVHTDHYAVFTAVLSVLKAFNMRQFGVERILSFETLSSTEAAPALANRVFLPTVFLDISAMIDEKLAIMALYVSEAQPDPLPRGPSAIRALARYRGASVGVEYAEAFMLIRELQ